METYYINILKYEQVEQNQELIYLTKGVFRGEGVMTTWVHAENC